MSMRILRLAAAVAIWAAIAAIMLLAVLRATHAQTAAEPRTAPRWHRSIFFDQQGVNSMTEIIDTNHDTTRDVQALKAAGIKTIVRYLSPINPHGEKCIKPAEAQTIAAAGLRLALVCEGWGDFAHGAISGGAGERDGEWCAKYAASVGAPAGSCIYFAVDTDANSAQIRKLVLPYFAAITAAFSAAEPRYCRGVYGSGDVCEAVLTACLADLSWLSCSMGWGGSRDYLAANAWALRQHVPATLCDIDCDADEANGDFGDFVPFAPAAQPAVTL